MQVCGKRGDVGDPQVKGRDILAQLFQEGQQEAPQAGIHVKPEPCFFSVGPQLGYGVDDAVGLNQKLQIQPGPIIPGFGRIKGRDQP